MYEVDRSIHDWYQDFDQFTLTLDHTKLKALDDLTSQKICVFEAYIDYLILDLDLLISFLSSRMVTTLGKLKHKKKLVLTLNSDSNHTIMNCERGCAIVFQYDGVGVNSKSVALSATNKLVSIAQPL